MKIVTLLLVLLSYQISMAMDLEVRVYSTDLKVDADGDALAKSGVVGVYGGPIFRDANVGFELEETKVIHDALSAFSYRIIPMSAGLAGNYSEIEFSFDSSENHDERFVLKAGYKKPVQMITSLEVMPGEYVLFQHVDLAKKGCIMYAVRLIDAQSN